MVQLFRWRLRHSQQLNPTPIELLEEKEAAAAIEAAVSSLSPRRREVFELVRLHRLSYQQVAETLPISAQTVANHMNAALSKLRRQSPTSRIAQGGNQTSRMLA